MKFLGVLAAAMLAAAAQAAPADPFDLAARTTIELAKSTRSAASAPPAMAVVATVRGRAPVLWVDGVADVRRGTAATPDTRFYIASMTKAYVGLMAATLDARRVFDLDQTLADVWPGVTVPGADPKVLTFRQLLSHQGAFENDALNLRTAYVAEAPAADYPAFLARSRPRAPGFQYDNLGYLVYGAALETRTGRHWRDWLEEVVLRPLDLTNTAPRVSDAADRVAGHHWIGETSWAVSEIKADGLMHAAGGLMTSPADMARWLQANADKAGGGLPARAFAEAHQQWVAVESQVEGLIDCGGYSLGWRICDVAGETVLLHGGSYTGARSWMAFAPGRGAGVAVMANSDSLTGHLGAQLMEVFLRTLVDPAYVPPTPGAFGKAYEMRLERGIAARRERLAARRAEARWQGWTWRPGAAELAAYAGRYRSDGGELILAPGGPGLSLSLGALRAWLEPAAPDLFGVAADPLEPPEPLAFERIGGQVRRLTWGGAVYERVD